MDGSYRIFVEITKVYEYLDVVEEGCKLFEIIQTMWEKTITGQLVFEVSDIWIVVQNIFLFWYGLAWTNHEDCGLAFGVWVKLTYNITMEDFLTSDRNWECPDEEEIERATYNDWIIGYW